MLSAMMVALVLSAAGEEGAEGCRGQWTWAVVGEEVGGVDA
jgi:hypothetical protein